LGYGTPLILEYDSQLVVELHEFAEFVVSPIGQAHRVVAILVATNSVGDARDDLAERCEETVDRPRSDRDTYEQ